MLKKLMLIRGLIFIHFVAQGNITDEVKKNGIVCGKITKVLSRSGLLVELPGHKCGLAHITELFDEYKENPLEEFKPKMFVK